jgi:hypothetical protein
MKSKTLNRLRIVNTVNTAMAIIAAVKLEPLKVEMKSAIVSEHTAPATTSR